jgi:hypothetical protein
MSLGVVIKGPEGLVLATDSRITLQAQKRGNPPLPVNFDNATKLLAFSGPHTHVGAVTYGAAVIGSRTAHSFIPEFELELEKEGQSGRLEIHEYSKALSDFFLKQWKSVTPDNYDGPDMTFIVGGYDAGAAYGKVFLFEIPGKPDPESRHQGENEFGMTWGGQLEVASRLIHGIDPQVPLIIRETVGMADTQVEELVATLRSRLQFPIPYRVLPLQDCVDLATFLIRSTIIAQDLAVAVRGVGGPIDVAIITRIEGLKYVQKKRIHGETRREYYESAND